MELLRVLQRALLHVALLERGLAELEPAAGRRPRPARTDRGSRRGARQSPRSCSGSDRTASAATSPRRAAASRSAPPPVGGPRRWASRRLRTTRDSTTFAGDFGTGIPHASPGVGERALARQLVEQRADARKQVLGGLEQLADVALELAPDTLQPLHGLRQRAAGAAQQLDKPGDGSRREARSHRERLLDHVGDQIGGDGQDDLEGDHAHDLPDLTAVGEPRQLEKREQLVGRAAAEAPHLRRARAASAHRGSH